MAGTELAVARARVAVAARLTKAEAHLTASEEAQEGILDRVARGGGARRRLCHVGEFGVPRNQILAFLPMFWRRRGTTLVPCQLQH